jgi:hypothetical protein
MPRAHQRKLLLIAGLMLAGAGSPAAWAQEGPTAAAPVPVPTLPGPAAEGALLPDSTVAPAGPTFGHSVAPAATAPQGCTCGNRRGLSRWRWHRRNCKRHLQDNFLGYAEEFNEWPLGESLYAHGRTQVANGLAAKMVFYHYDFVDGTSQLNTRGRDKLATVAATLPTNFLPIVVERTPNEPGLDQSRKSVLVAELGRGSFPVPAERVLIGPTVSYGMTGYEALYAIYPGQISSLAGGSAFGPGGSNNQFIGGVQAFDSGGLSGGLGGAGVGAVGR